MPGSLAPVQDTIVALATPQGTSGVAILRFSGPQAAAILLDCTDQPLPRPRYAVLRRLKDPRDGEPLDHALVLWFPGPASFTGEDVVEWHVHGSRAVIRGCMEAVLSMTGVRLAEAGEFARRGFLHGKCDLTSIEALADLIESETRMQRLQALRQSTGKTAESVDRWRESLLDLQALLEVSLDFPDEDLPDSLVASMVQQHREMVGLLERAIEDSARGERLREGYKIALVGPPNAGKSTLINLLARQDIALVSEHAGTTRDAVSVTLDIRGYAVTLTDTAGIRETEDPVERAGIARSVFCAGTADLVWIVADITKPFSWDGSYAGWLSDGAWVVANKTDRWDGSVVAGWDMPALGGKVSRLSCHSGDGLEALWDRVSVHLADRMGGDHWPIVTHARHRQAVQRARDALISFDLSAAWVDWVFAAEMVREAAESLATITGRVETEDVLGRIFGRFCIGK
jgi:tRNA modification GTPase